MKKKPFVNDISVANSHFFEKYSSRKGQFKFPMEKTFLKIKKKKEKKKKRQESLHNNKRLKKGLKLKLKAVKKLTVFAQHCLVWVI